MPLTVWCNASLRADAADLLQQNLGPNQLIVSASAQSSNLTAGEPDPLLTEADVAFGQPDPKQVIQCQRVRWVHINSAGYTRYDTAGFRAALSARTGSFTNSSAVYAEPCAQHALAMMMGMARRLPESMDDQRGAASWPSLEVRSRCFLMEDQLVLIYGYGTIGRRLGELLAPMRMRVVGVRRSAGASEGAVRMMTPDQADALLAEADHVVDILPASRNTDDFFNADRLGKMKRSAIFYNIGRGSTVDQYALSAVLETRRIAGAYLDVTAPEPLPPESSLWRLPNCFVTPHAAGGHRNEPERLVRHFLTNLKRYQNGQTLLDRVF